MNDYLTRATRRLARAEERLNFFEHRLTQSTRETKHNSPIKDWNSNFSKDTYKQAVSDVIEAILRGDIFQANQFLVECYFQQNQDVIFYLLKRYLHLVYLCHYWIFLIKDLCRFKKSILSCQWRLYYHYYWLEDCYGFSKPFKCTIFFNSHFAIGQKQSKCTVFLCVFFRLLIFWFESLASSSDPFNDV